MIGTLPRQNKQENGGKHDSLQSICFTALAERGAAVFAQKKSETMRFPTLNFEAFSISAILRILKL
ncbi:MAG: hypothetical protein ACLSV6_08550, partial [Butyricicoccus sp.]